MSPNGSRKDKFTPAVHTPPAPFNPSSYFGPPPVLEDQELRLMNGTCVCCIKHWIFLSVITQTAIFNYEKYGWKSNMFLKYSTKFFTIYMHLSTFKPRTLQLVTSFILAPYHFHNDKLHSLFCVFNLQVSSLFFFSFSPPKVNEMPVGL